MSDKNVSRLKFFGFFTTAVFLCVIILSSFWAPSPVVQEKQQNNIISPNNSDIENLLMINQVLHTRWLQLESLYDETVLSLANPSKGAENMQSGKNIMDAEVSFAKMLDSISANYANSPAIIQIDSVVTLYRAQLQHKQVFTDNLAKSVPVNNIENSRSMLSESSRESEKIKQLETELLAKTALIEKLQSAPAPVASTGSTVLNDDKKVRDLQNELRDKTATIKKLQQQVKSVSSNGSSGSLSPAAIVKMQKEVEFLKWALRSEVSSNRTLTSTVDRLKQTNANLTNQLNKN